MLRKGFISKFNYSNNLKAGLNVALLGIPQGMAYALISGLPLYYGLLGSSVAAILGSLTGRSRFITLGPTNATAVLLFGVFSKSEMVSSNGQLDQYGLSILPSILLCTSIILIIAGLLRVSFLIKFISRTVITGYISAAALLIVVNQLRSVLGIAQHTFTSTNFFETILNVLKFSVEFSPTALSLSLITAILYLSFQYKFKTLPNVAVTLVISSVVGLVFSSFGHTVPCLSTFDTSLIPLSIPDYSNSIDNLDLILNTSFALALLCLIEGLSIGKSLASREGDRINGDKAAISFGVGNLGCALFCGMPASGSLTRSSLNVSSGAKTWHSNLYTGIFIMCGYFLLGNLVKYIPISVLATLVIFIGISLVKWSQIITALRTTHSDCITFLVTFTTGLFFSLQLAIFVGVITSVLLFLKKVAQPQMTEQQYNEKGDLMDISSKTSKQKPEVSIVHVEGELFFAAADLFYEQIRRVGENRNIKVLVLKLLNAHHLDATSVLALEELLEHYKMKGCSVILCEVRKDAIRILRNSGLLEQINRKDIFPHIRSNPTLSTAKAIKRARSLLDDHPAELTIFANKNKSPKQL